MKRVLACVGVVSAGLLVAACGPSPQSPPVGPPRSMSLVSIELDGDSAGSLFEDASSISADGRYVAFASGSSEIVPGDTNFDWDVFVRDLDTGTTTRVSVSSEGAQAVGNSHQPVISGDGRFVAFTSGRPTSRPATRTRRRTCSSTTA